MVKFKKKFLKLFLISTSAITVGGIASSPFLMSKGFNEVNKNSVSLNSNSGVSVLEDGTSSDDPSAPSQEDNNPYTSYDGGQQTTVKTIDFSNSNIIQNTAYDLENKGFATFTSSNGSDTPNQVTKFLTSNVYGEKGEIKKTAGSVDWSISTDKLISLVNALAGVETQKESTTLTLKGMLYSTGGNESYRSLFVLAAVNGDSTSSGASNLNGDYLFQIQWTDEAIGNKSQKAGDYRIAAKLSNTPNSYNFLGMESTATNTMQAINVPDLSKSNLLNKNISNYNISFITVSNGNFKIKPTTTPTETTEKKFKFDTNIIDKFNKDNYKPVYVNRINSNIFIIFKSDDETDIKLVRTPNLTSTDDIKEVSNLEKLNELNNQQEGMANPKKLNIQTIFYDQNKTKVLDLILTKQGSTKLLHAKIDFASYSLEESIIDNITFTSGENNLIQITQQYESNSTSISGYLGLTSDNKVVKLTKDFKDDGILYDFKSSTIDLGDIKKIYTKSGDSNWYAQMKDGTFALFSEDTLIGQWDKLSNSNSYELPVRFSIKSQNEVSSKVLYKKVASGNEWESTFLQYLASSNAYEDFIDVDQSSIDPRLNGSSPVIKVEILNQDKTNGEQSKPVSTGEDKKTYNVTLVFKQVLRQITSTGEVKPADDDSSKTIEIGRQTYTFNNEIGSIKANDDTSTSSDKENPIPTYVRNMYPSEIVDKLQKSLAPNASSEDKNFINYFVTTENVSGASYAFSGNDLNGTLNITVTVPLMWQTDDTLVENYSQTFYFGSTGNPFFAYNPFGKDSTGRFNDYVTPIDDKYAEQKENAEKIENLKGMFSTKLPSSLSKQDYFKYFLDLGTAFSNSQYLGTQIILPTDEDLDINDYINVIPDDINGTAFVEITFPQIGPKLNYKVSFQTPAVFAKDTAASQTVYFSWKNKDNIDLSNGEETKEASSFSTIKASEMAETINGAAGSISTSGAQSLLDILSSFADFSSYYANLISEQLIKVKATYSDKYGVLNIDLIIDESVEIPGISSNIISSSYTGFKTESNSSNDTIDLTTTTFQFGNFSGDKSKSPSSVTEADLIAGGLLNKTQWEKVKANNNAKLTLTPSNSTGVLQVSVTLSNYVTDQTILPSKTFTTTITGFKVTNQQNNLISWKSNNDLGINNYPQQVKSNVLSEAGNQLSKDYNYKILKQLAYISSELDEQLQNDPSLVTNVSLIENNKDGTLSINATIKINGQNQVFSTVVNGLKGTDYSYNLEFKVTGDGTGNASLTKLRQQLPSTIKADNTDLLNLFDISASKNLVKQVILSSDDFSGTLTIQIRVIDPQNNNNVLIQDSRTFSGFVTQTYGDAGTNWLIVAVSIVVPVVVLTIPIVAFGYIQNRRDMKRIGKRLSTRLTEERERAKRREKLQQLNGKKL